MAKEKFERNKPHVNVGTIGIFRLTTASKASGFIRVPCSIKSKPDIVASLTEFDPLQCPITGVPKSWATLQINSISSIDQT